MPCDAIQSDTEDGAEKWLVLNRDMSEKWPNITKKKMPHLMLMILLTLKINLKNFLKNNIRII